MEGGGGLSDKREAMEEEEKKTLGAIIPGSVLAAVVVFLFFSSLCNFNMFLRTSSLDAITPYRLLMSSDFDKLLNCF